MSIPIDLTEGRRFDTPFGHTQFRSDDDIITMARKAIALSGLVGFPEDTPRAILQPTHLNHPGSIALAWLYIRLAQTDPKALAISLMEEHASPEDAALFKMFWGAR